jgi:hypothetical protein
MLVGGCTLRSTGFRALQHALSCIHLLAFMMIFQFFLNTIDILHIKIKSSKKKSVGGFIHDGICIFTAKTRAFHAKKCMSQILKSSRP